MAKCPIVTLADGNKIPALGLGTWKSAPSQVYEAVKEAIRIGYRHIDCALVYLNEPEVGRAISHAIKEGLISREELFITSKCWNSFHSKQKVVECCNRSMRALGVDYIDLYLVHWPQAYKEDGDLFPKDENGDIQLADIDYLETWEGMEECKRKGLVRSIGVSNFNSEQITRLVKSCQIKPVMNQIECHPYLPQKKLIALCADFQIKTTAYSPLGSPDRPWAPKGEKTLMEDETVKAIAKKHGVTAAQVLIRYPIERGLISIPKSTNKERIAENFKVLSFSLDPADVEALNGLDRNFRACVLDADVSSKYYPFNIPY
ncbi:aldo-keto reductase family 1 member B1 isoform X4 [Dermacentor silvarum]|uniref:aldo-keto reductase family 1 member B1 isoform X5 n=1 Tax=Dermacentor silvarum TaxID=543639 RepID=UPI00189A1BA5|nr:aldo-keto reductase family 1 member B1 isoform X5 [Dermacentor silvarum]XP_049525498.1 aldo-keto reductase family 1 member B1 isoform X1 [Dermacentor silvarum]XP_049525499.1 aldo-keto reductase family 1 member B1 isoform X2 [Dermacentor silvarum]XP_049525500.1 aldo-keto reductase family 1 member B1 isoform X3 [Dermacentor silvarum]XP_049525501.1 aldo-keto reductase family 1 member B1 isoform X4 [Dermacentor silvarum]